jgi:hypothetical protein
LALEFYNRIGRKSGFRPSEAESLYLQMLNEEGVDVLLGRALKSVEMNSNRLLSICMETGETIRAAMFVDATYEGDLLAAANVSYRVGREPASAYGESLAGQFQNVSWSNVYQFCRLPLSPYVEPGNPESGLLPEISSEPPGNVGDGDFKVQAYNFRVFLTDRAEKIAFPKPRGYDPGRYALLARFLNADPRIRWTLDYATRPMTDGPVQVRVGDSNNAGSFSSDVAEPAKPLPGLVMDDSGARTSGGWQSGTLAPISGAAYLHDGNEGKGEKTVTFEVKVPKPGDYQVNFLYVAHANRSTKTRVTVAIGDEKKEIVVNQRERDGNGKSLGTYRIETVITITVANRDTDGFVVVDGVQLLPR